MEKDKIKEIIDKSGNSFHCEVVKFLREREWEVLISPYYNDNITDKPREIDIIAEKKYDINEWGEHLGVLMVRLFIECKYINGEIVFWFDKKDMKKAEEKITTDISKLIPGQDFSRESHHYYNTSKVAKLFASNPNKLQDNEMIYKALNQSLNAMLYFKLRNSTDNRILETVNYPLILCNSFGKLYKVDLGKEEKPSQISKDYFQLEIDYAYLTKKTYSEAKISKREYFLVDIIDFNKFDKFLKMLEENDIKAIQRGFGFKKDMMNKKGNQ